MQAILDSFDHVTILVRELDAAALGYERMLGAPAIWRGDHPEHGTRAALFALENGLLELVGPREGAVEADAMRALLETRGEGIEAIAFGTADAAACSNAFRQAGLRATAPQAGEAVGADGVKRSYQTVELSPRTTRGLHVYAVQRADRAQLLASAADSGNRDASHVDAFDHVVIRSAAPDAAIALYEKGMGIRLALDKDIAGTRMLFFRVGGVTLELVHDANVGDSDTFYGLAYRVRDLAAAHARMRAAGLAVSDIRVGTKPGTQVFTVRDQTCGVPTLVLRDPARDAKR